jgi:hypothetical protein
MILASGSLDIRFWGKYKGEIQRTVVGWLVTNSYRVFQGSIFFFLPTERQQLSRRARYQRELESPDLETES